ncbi:MAG: FAD-binding oxidoreductase [Proteobacteria bacterium]|nr:FAD-binding oxidoreductase [Pseudomonadota bacterium]
MEKLSKEMYKELENVLGKENVSQEPALLDGYAWQPALNVTNQKWISRPIAAVLPKTPEEVQKIIKLCIKYNVKMKPHSTGWAAWGGPSEDGMLMVDLRRMNRIIELNEKDKYAVVEPYVCCSQLQAEAMKKGLTCHIIGAGPNTSALASATAAWGYGGSGLSTGFSGRNLLGVEWVMPDGEILRIGSPGCDSGWFSGDGPGPGLRGIMRGFAGTQGSLGVFTKCAVKLFPYYAIKEPKVKGVLYNVRAEVTKTEKLFAVVAPSFKTYADFTYKFGTSEIGHTIQRAPFGAFLHTMVPRATEKFTGNKSLRAMGKAFQNMGMLSLSSESEREVEFQEKVLREIVRETRCILIDISKTPAFKFLWMMNHRSIPTALTFRAGGDFTTSYGSPVEYDNAMLQAKVAQKVKQKYIDNDVFFDDFSDIGWGAINEGTATWGHCEIAAMYDRRDGKADERFQYLAESAETTVEYKMGVGLSNQAPGAWKIYGPQLYNYHLWQARIKKEFDPHLIGDEEFYVPSIDEIDEIMAEEKK